MPKRLGKTKPSERGIVVGVVTKRAVVPVSNEIKDDTSDT